MFNYEEEYFEDGYTASVIHATDDGINLSEVNRDKLLSDHGLTLQDVFKDYGFGFFDDNESEFVKIQNGNAKAILDYLGY